MTPTDLTAWIASRGGIRAALLTDQKGEIEIAHVKLDKSGKTVRVILGDCTPT